MYRHPHSATCHTPGVGPQDMNLPFSVLPERFAIARLAPTAQVPIDVLDATGFVSISRTADELSIVCTEALADRFPQVDRGWRVIKIHGPFAFDQVGILASLLTPLAAASIGIFAISTFDTDYILVKSENLDRAVGALGSIGYQQVG